MVADEGSGVPMETPNRQAQTSRAVSIGVLGAGAWGYNLVRNVAECEEAHLAVVCDTSDGARARVAKRFPGARVVSEYDELLATPGLDAVIIATPPKSHFGHARTAIRAGLGVLVEKPIATASSHAAELCRLARQAGVTLMCGHTMLFNNAVHEVKRRITCGELGDIRYLYCRRVNLGRVRPDVDALWNLAPHDISMICFLLDSWPHAVNARGWSYVQPLRNIADVCFFQMDFDGGVAVSGHVSWLDPQKDRRVVVVGSERMLVYDDLSPSQTIQIYDKSVEVEFQAPVDRYAEYGTRVRAGDLVVPHVSRTEPLAEEIKHFVDCVRHGRRPITDGMQGFRLVRVLEAMSESMCEGGKLIPVDYAEPSPAASNSEVPADALAPR